VADLPSSARCVIIGGGVGGCSIAYHLAELGWRDVVLVERAQLTSGSTFHSAGLVGQLRSSVSLTRMMMYSVELYRRLDPGWVECGGIRLACTPERWEETRRQAGWAKTFGLPLELISPEEARERFPLMVTDRVIGASWLPTDGYLDPSMLTFALADGARQGGCRIFTNTRVTAIDVDGGAVTRVRTERGDVECEIVVNAAGIYAAEIGRLAGVRVPVVPMAHEYVVTQPFRERDAHLATMRDPDHLIYFREEGGGLVWGGYERASAPWFLKDGGLDDIPADFNGRLLEEDWDRFEEIVANARMRVPILEDTRITRLINGPEAFTPDGEFCLGETEVRGLFVAAGFCAHGLAGAGGVGRVMAEWIAGGEPELDLWAMDVRRFGAHYRSPSYTVKRVREVYETYYDIKYPNHERRAGRPLRVSPLYDWHREHGAVFGEKAGWERVNWYAANEAAGDEALRPRGWAGRHWSPAIGAEHAACRQAAALFDETSFAKIEVSGPGAAALLEHVCDNRVAREVGRITYTQMLNSRGGIECDFTVSRLAEDRFGIVTGTAFGRHDLGWIARHARPRDDVRVEDVTSRWACIGLWGPKARDVLAAASTDDLSFGYLRWRDLTVGDVPVRALRVTYVGELGWELYCPMEYGSALWRTLWEAGRPHGLLAGGYRAIDSLRLEKGYRVWGADITPDDTPYEGGVGFCVRADKNFVGKGALDPEPARRLCCLTLADPRSVALANEPVRVGGAIVGRVTSGGYGYTVQRSIAYAYLPAEHAAPGTEVAVEIFGEWVHGEVATEPLFDPEGAQVR
jgi:4-methylaminobutanoate oxidase (formaldehyde-forming)